MILHALSLLVESKSLALLLELHRLIANDFCTCVPTIDPHATMNETLITAQWWQALGTKE